MSDCAAGFGKVFDGEQESMNVLYLN